MNDLVGMKREDYERLKETEKAHLREIQKLKQRLREAERRRSIGKALHDAEAAGETEAFDEALTRVQLEAAEEQAKLDLAIDSTEETSSSVEVPDPSEIEAELTKARAAELVRHMKISMGMQESDEVTPAGDETGRQKSVGKSTKDDDPEPEPEAPAPERPETDVSKTIGRMKSGDD